MSFTNNDIHNAAGPGSSAEPSMEEILASIRRILKEDEPGKPAEPVIAPVDMDDDILLLDASMIAKPADVSTATMMPATALPASEPPATPLQSAAEPLHFSSEPVPFSRDFGAITRTMPEPVVELPPTIDADPQPLPEPIAYRTEQLPPAYTPLAPDPVDFRQAALEPSYVREPEPIEPARFTPSQPKTEPAAELEPVWRPAATPSYTAPSFATSSYTPPNTDFEPPVPTPAPEPAAPSSIFTTTAAAPREPNPEPDQPATKTAPEPLEPDMNDQPTPNSFEPPDGLISDKTTDAAASSIGALVRSMSTEKSIAISKNSSITIEDIVREEIRPLLKSWLDTHLPSLVERVVRSEIERVINRSVV